MRFFAQSCLGKSKNKVRANFVGQLQSLTGEDKWSGWQLKTERIFNLCVRSACKEILRLKLCDYLLSRFSWGDDFGNLFTGGRWLIDGEDTAHRFGKDIFETCQSRACLKGFALGDKRLFDTYEQNKVTVETVYLYLTEDPLKILMNFLVKYYKLYFIILTQH